MNDCNHNHTLPASIAEPEPRRYCTLEYNNDPINPQHYKKHPSGVECIDIIEHFSLNVGTAIKYLWRAGHKNHIEDLKKAQWFVNREIQRLEKK